MGNNKLYDKIANFENKIISNNSNKNVKLDKDMKNMWEGDDSNNIINIGEYQMSRGKINNLLEYQGEKSDDSNVKIGNKLLSNRKKLKQGIERFNRIEITTVSTIFMFLLGGFPMILTNLVLSLSNSNVNNDLNFDLEYLLILTIISTLFLLSSLLSQFVLKEYTSTNKQFITMTFLIFLCFMLSFFSMSILITFKALGYI